MNTSTGIFTPEEATKHRNDPGLAAELVWTFRGSNLPVIDYGCGNGHYLRKLEDIGLRCFGYDGTHNTPRVNQTTIIADLTEPLEPLPIGPAHVLCLEVGEHIPREHEEQFLENILRHLPEVVTDGGRAPTMVLSWAIPGQAGTRHVNCRTNEEVIDLIESRSHLRHHFAATADFRESATLWWFKQTLMVFA